MIRTHRPILLRLIVLCLFVCVGLVLSIGVLEIGVRIFSRRQDIRLLRTRLAAAAHLDTVLTNDVVHDSVKSYVSGYIPHPYVGFVNDPTKQMRPFPVNEYGWYGPSPLTKKQPDTVVVAIFGGSVAESVYKYASGALQAELEKNPVFAGKKIQIVETALEGYKQPQQAMALEYMFAQGAEYDVVLNIDGFNEITLPGADNYWQKVAPIFPRSWNWYSQTLLNAKMLYSIIPLYVCQDIRTALAHLVASSPLSTLYGTVWYWNLIDTQLDHFLAARTGKLQHMAVVNTTYQTTGPVTEQVPDSDKMIDYSVNVWKRSSLQMAALTAAGGGTYLHVLQPTAYFRGSKHLTDEEKRLAFIDESITDTDPKLQFTFRQLAALGYPKLVKTGLDELVRHEYFVDATQIFSNEQGDMYTDMCHLNEKGMQLFVQFLSDAIVGAYQKNMVAPGK